MKSPPRSSAAVLATLLAGLSTAWSARAVGAETEAVDDPKLARRLGTRVTWTSSPPPPALAAVPSTAVHEAPVRDGTPVGGPAANTTAGGVPVAVAAASAVPEDRFQPSSPPRLKLAYRRFDFVRIGASNGLDGAAANEPFNSFSVDVYPVSSLLRVGLSTQYGWQSGTWLAKGDYFAAESLSVGVQMAGQRLVPFAEVFAGIGYMRRVQFDRTVPTAYWQLGFDVGAELYFARVGFVSLALGYLRPVNGLAKVQEFQTVFVDTWSFKLGIGL